MTAELRARLEDAIGQRMSSAVFFAHPTTDQLVEHLLERLAPAEIATGGTVGGR
jgi:hypothetical protein